MRVLPVTFRFISKALILLFVLYSSSRQTYGQTCDATTPSFTIDMTGHPDSTWISSNVQRQGNCCSDKKKNDVCVEFIVTLDPNAEAIKFFVASGAMPSGSLYWQLDCGTMYPVNVQICISGGGTHTITFCKPGNNDNTYGITSISKPTISPPTVSANYCTGTLSTSSFSTSTIQWTTINPGAIGQYNSYLSCTSGCDSITVNYIPGLSYVDVQATGMPAGGCSSVTTSITSRVYFVNNKSVSIAPKYPTICFGGTYTQITATGSGGAQPYSYSWSNGDTGATINAPSVGWYIVTMTDTTSCPPVQDSVYVSAYTSPITANAGPDDTSCANNPTITLNGSVTTATKGRWSGGSGTYSPNDSSLTATYTPTASEISAGTVTHILTTIDNGTCPPVKDTMIQTILKAPVVTASAPASVCANNSKISLTGSVTNASGGQWSGGTGTYFPNNTTINTTYTPSQTEINNKTVNLTLTTTGNGKCVAVSKSVSVSITDPPTINAGPDDTVCANNANVSLSASYTGASGINWTTTGNGTFANSTSAATTYTPGSNDKTSGSVILIATTSGTTNNCTPVSDSVIVTITPSPTANAGPDVSVCGNNSTVTLNGQVTVTSTGQWLGGTGTFSNRTALNATYTPSASEITNGFVDLVLSTTNNGKCNAVTDTMQINIAPAPVANAGPDVSVCGNNATVTLSGTVQNAMGLQWYGGTGTFSPNRNTGNATYTPSNAEISAGTVSLRLTTIANTNCIPVTDTINITITPAPTVTAGPNQSVCANNASVNLNGSYTVASGVQWSGGTGSFSSTTDPKASYTPSTAEISAGSTTLTLTTTGNANCKAVSATTTISITPQPTVNAGADVTVCANNPSVTLNGSVQVATGGVWSGGGGTFSPNNSTLNATYTPSATEITNGSVSLTLTSTGNGKCLAVSDLINITITPAPTASAGANQTVCANNPAVTLNGTVTVTTTGQWSGGQGTFSPSTSALNATYTPSATEITNGTATLILTTTNVGNCVPVSDSMNIRITPAPVVNPGTNQTVCGNNPTVTLNGSVTVTGTGAWSGGNGTFSPNATTLNASYTPSTTEINSGTVILKLTSTNNGNCLPVYNDMTITINPTPIVDAGTDRTVCANNVSLVLNGQIQNTSSAIWSGGSGTFNPNASTLNATYTPSAAEITAGTTTLKLTASKAGCLPVSDSMTITINPKPVVNAGPDQVACSNNPQISLSGTVTNAGGGTWSGGSGVYNPGSSSLTASYTPTSAEITQGYVILTLTTTGNGLCNAESDQIRTDFTASPTVNPGSPQTLCANNQVATLSGQVTVATGGTWSGGSGTFSNSNSLNTTYTPTATEITNGSSTLTLTTTGNGDCKAISGTITLSYTPAPTANAGADRTVCANNASFSLAGKVTVATGGTWSGGSGTFSAPNSLNTNYTPSNSEITAGAATLILTTTGNGSCNPVSDTVHITITPSPTVNAGPDLFVCGNNPTVTLNGQVTIATGGQWVGGSGTFIPDRTTLNAQYTPSSSEVTATIAPLILETTGNGNCLPAKDTMLIVISSTPSSNAGSTQTVCKNNPNVILNGLVTNATGKTWSGGNGTFNPNINTLNATYTPTANELTSGQVTLTLTATRATCNPVSSNVTILFSDPPTVNAGPDQTLCSNNPVVKLNGSVTMAGGGTWSGGAGTFSPSADSLNTTYHPTASEIASKQLKLILTSRLNGSCLPVSDTMIVNFTPAPTSLPGSPQSVCANKSTISLNGAVTVATGGTWSGGTGTFSPNTSTLNATYVPSAAEIANGIVYLTLTTTGNGNCLAVSDSVKMTITPAPTANPGANFDICANNPIAPLNGSVTVATGGIWTGGNGTFSPNANTLNATYQPTATEIKNGSVTLTLETTGNGNCNFEANSVIISITNAPTVDAGPPQSVCGNTNSIQLNGKVTVAIGGQWSTSNGTGTFSPSADSLNTQYIPSSSDKSLDSVSLILTTTGNGKCTAVASSTSITFTPVPSANAGPDQTVCTNDLPIQLNGSGTTSSWNGGTGTFSPSRNVLNPTYMPSAAEIAQGFVDLTLTTTVNGSCSAVSDAVHITIPPGPVVNAGADEVICGDVSSVPLNGSVLNAGGGTWTTLGQGSFSPSANTPATNYVLNSSDINAGPIRFILTSTSNGNCTAESDTMYITFTNPPTVNPGPNRTICADKASINLAGQITVATGAVWSTSGKGTFSDSSALNTRYIFAPADTAAKSVDLTLTTTGNGTCKAVSASLTVTITSAPTVNAGPDQTICADSGSVNLNGTVTTASGGAWSTTGNGTFSPNNTTLSTSYYPTATDTAAHSVPFVLTTTGNGTCNAVSDTLMLTILPTPVVNAGSNQSICADKKSITLNGQVLHATGGIWSSSGTGTFSPTDTDLNAVYTLSSADSTGNGVTLTLTSTGNGTCNAVQSNTFITITPAPTVNAGPDQTVCANNANVTLEGKITVATGAIWSGAGVFTPNDTSLNANYQPTSAEISAGIANLVLTTTGNGTCNAVSDTLTITITPAPVVNPGSNITVCGDTSEVPLNGSVTNATGGIWSSSGTGYFSPSETTLNAFYIPSSQDTANKSVILTLTSEGNGNCLAISEAIKLTITPAPTVKAGSSVTVCGNNASVALQGKVTVASGGTWSGGSGTFSPSSDSLNTTYTPSASEITAGTVTLTLITTGNGSCKAEKDNLTLTITPAPVVEAGNDLSVCANNPSANLSGSVTIATGGVWSNGKGVFVPDSTNMDPSYTLTSNEIATGFVNILLTSTGNGQCNPVTDTVRINVLSSPVVNAGPDQTVCADTGNIQLAGSVTNATGGIWTTNGTGTFSPNANTLNAQYIPSSSDTSSGKVTLVLTSDGNGNCFAVSDTMNVIITPAPTVNAGPNQIVCGNNAAISLNGALTVSSGGIWSGGSGTFSPSADSLNTVYTPSATEISNGSVTLTLTTTGNGTCKAVNSNINIQITPAPTVNAGPDKTACENNPVVSLAGTITTATGGIWSGGSGTFVPGTTSLDPDYTLSSGEVSAGKAILILTSTGNGKCLPVTDTITITTTPSPTVNAGPDQTICADSSSVSLSGTVGIATGGIWSTSGSGTFTPNQTNLNAQYTPDTNDKTAGKVFLTLTSTGNGTCNPVTDTMTVFINPAPTANAGPNDTVCADVGSINLNGIVTVATGGIWSGGSGVFADSSQLTTTYTPSAQDIANESATLILTTTGNGMCKAVSDYLFIEITPAPTVNAGLDQTVCADAGTIALNGKITVASGGIWTTNGTGSFAPDSSSLSVDYTPSAKDTANHNVTFILTTTGNGLCKPKEDTLELTITPVPVVFAGSSKTVCADAPNISLSDAYVHNAPGGQWTSTGSGTFSPSSTTVNATYVPSQADINAGNLKLTLTSTGMSTCNPVSSTVQVTINPAPTVNAGTNDTVCANTPSVTLKGQYTIAGGAIWSTGSGQGSFSPSDTDLNAVFTPDASQVNAGIATVILTTTGNGLCKAATSKIFIVFKPEPVVNTGPNQTVCEDLSGLQLNGNVTNATGGTWITTGTGTFSNPNILNPVYSPSSDDKIAGQITLKLTSTGNSVCQAKTDTMVLKIDKAPTVNAGPAAICSDAGGVQLNGSITNALGEIWTTSGTGTFTTSSTILDPTYNPSASDVSAGNVTLTLTTTGNGPCSAVSDSIILSITPIPVADAGPDQVVCANAGDVQLNGKVTGATGGTWTSSGGGAFSPNANTLNAKYTPSAADIINGKTRLTLTTTGVGLCKPGYDSMIVTITPAPTVNPGSSETVCADTSGIELHGSVTIATGGTWSSATGGSFSPSANNLNAVYMPSASDITNGNVTLTLTSTGNGNCNPVSRTVTMKITPAPTANIGPDFTICADASSVALDGQTTVASGREWYSSGNGSFTPDSSSQFISYNVTPQDTANGSVTIYMKTTGNGMCKPAEDTALITITPAPHVNVAAGGICADKDTIPLQGSVSVATGILWTTSGSGAFTPDSVTLNAGYIPSAADKTAKTVTLTITSTGNGTCNAVSDSVVINISPPPLALAGNDTTVCAQNSGILLNGSVNNASGGQWSTLGSGTFNNATNLNATYTASQADTAAGNVKLVLTTTGTGSCAAVSDTMMITFTPAPIVNAGPAIICSNVGIINLSGSVYNAGGLQWTSSGDGTFATTDTDPNVTYTFGPNDSTTKKVTIVLVSTGNGICAQNTDTVLINMANAPSANAGGKDTICADVVSYTLNGSETNASGLVWSTLGTGVFSDSSLSNAQYFPSTADTASHNVELVLTTTGNGVCAAVTDTFKLDIKPTPVVDAGPASVCSNNATVNLTGSVLHAGGGQWSARSGADGTFANASQLTTTYTPGPGDISKQQVTLYLTSVNMGTCNPVTDSLILYITQSPTPAAGGPLTVCADASYVQLSGNVSGNATGGAWTSLGSGTFSDSTDLNGKYFPSQSDTANHLVKIILTTTGNGNCKAVSDTLNLTINPAPISEAGPDQTICANQTATLAGNIYNAGGGGWTTSGSGTFNDTTQMNAIYTPSAADTAAGSVQLILTSTLNGTCIPVSNSMLLKLDKIPFANAGPSSICSTDPGIQLDGTVLNATGGIWTTSGTGSFAPNATTINAIYLLSANDTTAGIVTLTLTTSGNGACTAAQDSIVVNITNPPTVNAGSDQTICANTDIMLKATISNAGGISWNTNGTGLWSPDSTSLSTNYLPSASEAKTTSNFTLWFAATTTGTAPCAAASDTLQVTLTPAPIAIVNAGNDTTLCASNPNVPLHGTISVAQGGEWSSSGNGTFSPNAFTLDATYLPDASDLATGSVKLALTTTGNGSCIPVSDTMVTTFTQEPTANAGPDQTICADIGQITLAGKVTNAGGGKWTTSGTGSFDTDTLLNATYYASSGDIADSIIVLTLTTTHNGACASASDNKTLYIRPAPIVNAGLDQSICADNRNVSLEGKLTYADSAVWTTDGTGTISPSADSLDISYSVTDADTTAKTVHFYLTVPATGGCLTVIDTVSVTIGSAPTANPGPPQTICADSNAVQLNGSVTMGTGGVWTTSGTGSFAPDDASLDVNYIPSTQDTAAGLVTLTLTTTGTGQCHPVSASTDITITPAPIVNAGPDQTVCANNAQVQLAGKVLNATGGIWTGGNGTFTTDSADLNAIYTPTATEISAGIVQLRLTSTGMGTCNPVSDFLTITITGSPTVDAGPDQTLCANNPEVTLKGNVSIASGGDWSGGSGSFIPDTTTLSAKYSPTVAEISAKTLNLILTSTGNGNCKAVTDTTLITFTNAPTASAGGPVSICADKDSIQLNGTITIAAGGSWSSSGSGAFSPSADTSNATYTPSASDKSSGTISLILTTTGNGNCLAVTDTLLLTITPTPTVDAGPDKTVCANNPAIQLQGTVTTATGGTWSGGTGTFTPSADSLNTAYTPTTAEIAAGFLDLTLTTTGNGTCKAISDVTTVTFTDSPQVNAGPDQTVCANNDEVQLSGTVKVATGATWSGGSGMFTPNKNQLNVHYTPSAAESTAGKATLYLTTTGNGNCLAVKDSLNITITPSPTANSGGDRTICADKSSFSLNGSVTIASDGMWQTTGTGTFSPDNATAGASYQPSQTDKDSGSVKFVLTTTGNGNCLAVSDSFKLTITPKPSIDAGTAGPVCANNASVNLSGSVTTSTGGTWSGGSGTFNPPSSKDSLKTIYIPSTTEIKGGKVTLQLTSTGNGACNAISDYVTIEITPAPVVDAGKDRRICFNNPATQLLGYVSGAQGGIWGTGNGTFNPSKTNLFAIYTPTSAEEITGKTSLSLTSTGNGNCLAVSDTLNILVKPAPIVNAGSDQTVCADVDSVTLKGSVTGALGATWTTTGTGYFAPDANALNATYVPSDADRKLSSIGITLTSTGNGNCNPVSDYMVIKITPAPTVNAGSDFSVCADAGDAVLAGKVTTATGGSWTTSGSGSFQPSTSVLTTQYLFTSADIAAQRVIFTLTSTGNGTCKAVSDQVTLTITPAPTIDAGTGQTICANAGTITLNGKVTVATGGSWTTKGTGSFSNSNSLNSTYALSSIDTSAHSILLTVTSTGNGTCKAVSDSVKYTIVPEPVVSTGSKNICSDITGLTLNGKVYNAAGGVWSTSGSGTFAPDAYTLNATYTPSESDISSGLVTLTLTSQGNGSCAPVSTDMEVIITPLPDASTGPAQIICRGSSTVITAKPEPNVTYGWYTTTGDKFSMDGLISITTSQDTSFILAVTDTKGCTTYDTAHVSVTDPPILNLPSHYCYAQELVINAKPSFTPSVGAFEWYRNDTLLYNENSTTLTVKYYGQHVAGYTYGSCTVYDTSNITLPPSPDGPDKLICVNDTTYIKTTYYPKGSYQWSEDGTDFGPNLDSVQVIGDQNKEFIVKVTDSLGCSNNDTIELSTTQPPVLTLNDIQSCIGNTETIDGKPSNINSSYAQYEWFYNGTFYDTSRIIHVNQQGIYKLIYSLESCIGTDSSYVSFNPLPVPDNKDTFKFCTEIPPKSVDLDAGPATSYYWFASGHTTETETVTQPGYYYVKLGNQYNCYVTDSIYAKNTCPPRLFIPTAFTPNGDGVDDTFELFGAHFTNFDITIFNRWGEIIYYSNQAKPGWDGTYRGEPMQSGVYPYIVNYEAQYEEYNTGKKQESGTVVIIR